MQKHAGQACFIQRQSFYMNSETSGVLDRPNQYTGLFSSRFPEYKAVYTDVAQSKQESYVVATSSVVKPADDIMYLQRVSSG